MGKLIVITNLSLDGVMQAPGRSDEDTRNAFMHGGWGVPYAAMSHASEAFVNLGAFLFGRRTYQDFYGFWPKQIDGNPFSEILNNVPKFVASRTLNEPLPWRNSKLLLGDASQAVVVLKGELEKDILVFGSVELVQSLMGEGIIDEFVLLIHPLVLGSGRRLFADTGQRFPFELSSSKTTDKGVVIATYHCVRQ
jgi:dihydrofolate reductase